ncbi:type I-E CRISPR-associated protein Cas6/Cse3/CasE, partial [Escherichia coli]|nr:type I-E CRISPR-associated protein Cas6/Cse3/CasE [Escherichia coli]
HHAFSSGAGRTSDGNGSHASTLKSPSYTKSVSWQHYPKQVEFQLQVGVPLYFRLRANPIKTILDNQKRLDSKGNIKRCRVPLIKEAEQIAWLQRKLGNAARVEDVHPISERLQYFSGDGKSGKIQTVCFEGVITINDAPALIDLVQQGIGPAKSMGCGLLSLAPL